MDNEFYTLLTDRGMAKIANALADKTQLHLQKMAVGDGGGQYYEPATSQIALRHEVWRGEMNTLTVAPNNPNWLIAEVVLPEDIGGWYVREVGVFDADDELIAIGKFPESYKPLLPGGCGKQVCIRLIMEVSNTTAVTLTVDPSIVLATRDYVDSLMDEHEHSTNHPDATLTQKGFTQLSNATDSDDETKAATPKAVKAAMVEARNHTHTWAQITDIPDGTLTQKGIVKLNNATDSTSTTEAATPSAVKAAMDKANAALDLANTAASNGPRYQFFTENGTFTVPDGTTQVFVEMLGGGGGGGGGGSMPTTATSFHFLSGGIGGGAGESKITIVPVISNKSYSVVVGAGGAGGIGGYTPSYEDRTKTGPDGASQVITGGNSGEPGIAGGDSSFSNVIAKGGSGGTQALTQTQPLTAYPESPTGKQGTSTVFGSGGNAAEFANGGDADGYGAGGGGGASLQRNSNAALSAYSGGCGSNGFVKISW